MTKTRITAIVISLIASTPAGAAETILYKYDGRGRLIKVVRSGTVNNGITATYTHDKADNRQRVTVTGASH